MAGKHYVNYEGTDHRPTDLMSGITAVLEREYEKDHKKGLRVLKIVTDAMMSEEGDDNARE